MIRQVLIDLGATIVIGFATSAMAYIRSYVKTKLKNEKVDAAMLRLTNTTQTVVDNLTQTVVGDMKKDGEFTPSVKAAIRNQAYGRIVEQLPLETLKLIESSVGPLTSIILQKIEQAVLRGKK